MVSLVQGKVALKDYGLGLGNVADIGGAMDNRGRCIYTVGTGGCLFAMSATSEGDSLFRRITRLVGRAIGDFRLIQDRDRVLVALSGGKDSWTLLYALRALQKRAPVHFDLLAVTVHPGPEVFDCSELERRLARDSIPHHRIDGQLTNTINDNLTQGTNPCSFCARLRRGILYSYAAAAGWNKIALGHHMDDFVETLLLNMLFNASIKGMSPILAADDGKNTIIRPLVYVRETMTRQFAQAMEVPILSCFCSYQGMSGSRRRWVKELLCTIEKDVPHVRSTLLRSMGRVQPRHLLGRQDDELIEPSPPTDG